LRLFGYLGFLVPPTLRSPDFTLSPNYLEVSDRPQKDALGIRRAFVIISAVKALVQALLKPFGLRLSRVSNGQSSAFGAETLFSVLQQFGFLPKHIIDIGANHGNWTRSALRYFPEANYTLLEPQDDLRVHIQDLLAESRRLTWINAGASDTTGMLPFYRSHRDDSSSFLNSGPESTSPVPIKVWALDDLVVERRLPIPDMVKIDAEGLDLRVLRGASTLLGKTEIFLVEASVACPFENSVAATIRFMTEHGYRLMDITELNRSPKDNLLWLTELVFLRDGSPLLARATSYE